MRSISASLKKAVMEMLLLSFLNQHDMYGYELTQTLKKLSNGRMSVLEGSMYPILYRLEDDHHITHYKRLVGKRQTRVYYQITDTGRELYHSMQEEFHEYIDIINTMMETSLPEQEVLGTPVDNE